MEVLPRVRFSVSGLFAVLVTFCHSNNGHCSINHSTLDLITLTLYRDIQFMFERPRQMNVDAIFGLNFVEVHTTALLRHKNVIYLRERNRYLLEETSKICKLARENSKDVLSSNAFESMIRPELWNRTIAWKRGALGERPSVTPGLTKTRASSIIYQGSPLEEESSRCLGDLLDSCKKIECQVSKECATMLVRRDSSRGYPLTHRLLYVQTAIAVGVCFLVGLTGAKWHGGAKRDIKGKTQSYNNFWMHKNLGYNGRLRVTFGKLKKDYCASILQDLVDVEAANFPPPSIDLAMEQSREERGKMGQWGKTGQRAKRLNMTKVLLVLLCGMEGHLEFTNARYANLIASWANSHGCYSALGFRGRESHRRKRTTAFMDYGCDSHASGVAAASLSLLIRAAVENIVDESMI